MNFLILSINNQKCNILHNVVFNCLLNEYMLSYLNTKDIIRIIISSIKNKYLLPFLVNLSIRVNSQENVRDEEWSLFYNSHISPKEKLYSKKLQFDEREQTSRDDNNKMKSSFQIETVIIKQVVDEKNDKPKIEISKNAEKNFDFNESDFEF